MKRKIIISRQYKKDIKLARRRNLPEEELNEIVLSLANDIPLPAKNKDHALQGEFAGCRECHIRPDWLLIYSKESDGELHILNLLRTGTHSHAAIVYSICPKHPQYIPQMEDRILS